MLTQQFLDYIKLEKLFKSTDKLILAISGGLDSVVLAHLLHKIGQPFCLAHMNFQLRGKDSIEDQLFVEQLAKKLQVECFIKKVNITKASGEKSTQMQARELRYQWFQELLLKNEFKYIVTAHHANDNLETALLSICRGTSIKGVRGILPKHNQIVRPLLFASRQLIHTYAVQEEISWREDKSNNETTYKRNFLRHKVVPELERINPNVVDTFSSNSNRLRLVENIFEEKLQELNSKYVSIKDDVVNIEKSILELKDGNELCIEILLTYGFSYSQLNSFDFERTGALLDSLDYQLNVDRVELLLIPRKLIWEESIHMPVDLNSNNLTHELFTLSYSKIAGSRIDIDRNNFNVSLASDKLNGKVILRKWKEGDVFQPLGMKGQKKVSDYLIDKKVPLTLKNNVLVLTVDDEIAWLVGYEISEKFKVENHTKEQLKLKFETRN